MAEKIARHRLFGQKCTKRVRSAVRGPTTQLKMQKITPPHDIRNKQVTPRPLERSATAKGAQQRKGNVTLVNSIESLRTHGSLRGLLNATLMSNG